MDANKVLAWLQKAATEWQIDDNYGDFVGRGCADCETLSLSHSPNCKLAALIAEAEHEAQEPGGWRPGTEPPSDDRMVLVQYRKSCPAVGAYHSSIDGYNADRFGSCRLEPEHVQWHDLPPLPEAKP